jgi:hypothetical protein
VLVLIFAIGPFLENMNNTFQDVISNNPFISGLDGTDNTDNTDDTDEASDALYDLIESRIVSPDSSSSTKLPAAFTFTVKILAEAETRTVDGQERQCQQATIARCTDKYFLLDVHDLQERPKTGSVVSVSSTSYSTVDWVVDNQKNSLLRIKADSVKPVEPKTLTVNTSPTIEASAGLTSISIGRSGTNSFSGTVNSTIPVKGAHFTQDTFKKKVVVLYFDYTNTSDQSTPVGWNWLYRKPYLSLGDNNEYLAGNIFPLKELDDQALDDTDHAAPGKTTYYYAAYTVPANNNESRLYIKRFDDDFNLTDNIVLNVAPSLAQMKAP